MEKRRVIGIVGGGQLGRMLTLAALPLGFDVIVVDPGEHCPAAQVGATHIRAALDDAAAIAKLGAQCDFLTYEIEHFDITAVSKLAKAGLPVNPAPDTVALIQDKLLQKQFFQAKGLPVGPFGALYSLDYAVSMLHVFGGQMLVKARRGGFDGRGNTLVTSEAQLEELFDGANQDTYYAEQIIAFDKELAVMLAKDMADNVATYPVVETIHERNICLEVHAPALVDVMVRDRAEAIARQVGQHLQGAGVYGVELFLTTEGEIMINEIAPRVHNSGHYTMDAAKTSQFEQHIRAIAGLPLGETDLLYPAATMVNILGERNGDTKLTGLAKALQQPATHVHLYGKSPTKVDRKMGHITSGGNDDQAASERARTARKAIDI